MDKKIDTGTTTSLHPDTSNDPAPLFYRDEGAGLPVVLLHGFAEDHTLWDIQVEHLKTSYRLIIPDLPGSKKSTLDPQTSMESMADSILTILNHEGIDQCVLIGHSMGGYITLAFAEKYPGRLKGFGLFHSTAYPDSEEKKAARRKSIDFIRNNGSAPFIRQSTHNLFAAETRTSRPDLVETTINRYSGLSPDSLIAWYEAMIRRPDRTAVLKDASTPVLFIIGKEDQAIPPEHTLQQSHLPTLSHIHILHHSAHMGMLEEPGLSNNILQSFLNFINWTESGYNSSNT